MLSSIMTALSSLVGICLNAVAGIITLWPVAIMAGFLVLGIAIGFVKKMAGKRGRRRGR